MDTTFTIGFIGGGLNSAVGITHKIASQMDGHFKLVTGCFSRHNDINIQTAEYFNIDKKRLYFNWKELLEHEKDKIDAIVILTPTPSHYEILEETIKNQYAIICEKALVSSVDEGKKVKQLIHKYKNFLTVTFNYTGYPMIRELKNMINKGLLGDINQIHIEMPQETFIKVDKNGNPIYPQPWRQKDYDIPTVSLDLGVHLHSLIYFLTQKKPLEVVAIQNSFGHFKQVVDNVICSIKYSDNMICNMWYSKSACGHRNGLRLRIFGTYGSAEWYQMEPEKLIVCDNKGNIQIVDRVSNLVEVTCLPRYNRFKAGHPAGFIEAFANLYEDIADTLQHYQQHEDPPVNYTFDIDIALEGLNLLNTINLSAKEKTFIKLEEVI